MPKPMRICFDRMIPDSYQPARAEMARSLMPGVFRGGNAMGDLRSAAARPENARFPGVMRLALPQVNMWENGRVLKCRFLDGSSTQTKNVEDKAHMWEEFANITFRFVAAGDADIRISFVADSGSWSAVGNDALVEKYFPKYQPTMNFGWLRDDTNDTEYRRVVVHEFGHALAAIHEHEQPTAPLKWNKPEVYRVFSGPPNHWSKADIDHNIFDRYSREGTNFTQFDPDSIMLYQFDASLFLDKKGTKNNTDLSDQDKRFISQMYPKAAPKAGKTARRKA